METVPGKRGHTRLQFRIRHRTEKPSPQIAEEPVDEPRAGERGKPREGGRGWKLFTKVYCSDEMLATVDV